MPDPWNDPAPPAAFQTTHWSLVLRAGENAESPESRAALEELCRTYWYPLYAFVRAQGHSPEAAQDLTQEFFARLVSQDVLEKVNPARGRFRAYLLAVMKNVMAQAREKEQARKRGGGAVIFSLDGLDAEARYALEPKEMTTPESLFDRRWAETVLARTVTRLRADYEAAGFAGRFDALKEYLLAGREPEAHSALEERLGLTHSGLRSAVFKLRQRFAQVFRDEIAQTVATRSDVEEEIQYLAGVLVS